MDPSTGYEFRNSRIIASDLNIAQLYYQVLVATAAVVVPLPQALAQMRANARVRIRAVAVELRRRVVIVSWNCCRGNIFSDKPWRIMIWVLFMRLGSVLELIKVFQIVFIVMFSKELRLQRKRLGLVWACREHSFGFLQATEFVNEMLIQYAIYRATGVRLPFVSVAILLIRLGLLAERDGLCCYDGPLIRDVNNTYMQLDGSRLDCRLTVEVFLVIVFNMVIGTPALLLTVPAVIWSSCFWGSHSQSVACFLDALLPSYLALTYENADVMEIVRGVDFSQPLRPDVLAKLNAFAASSVFDETLDAGYPDEAIKDSRARGLEARNKFSEDLVAMFSYLGWV